MPRDCAVFEARIVYTFKLREVVTFYDGSGFDAAAVNFNLDRMLDESHPYHNTGRFPLFFSAIENADVIDPLTVQLTLNARYAPFLSNLRYPTGLVAFPAAVMEHEADLERNPTGTGAFKFIGNASKRRLSSKQTRIAGMARPSCSLPALAAVASGVIVRPARSAMLAVLRQGFIRSARGKQGRKSRVIWVRAQRAVKLSIIPMLGIQLGFMLSGAVYIEMALEWPA